MMRNILDATTWTTPEQSFPRPVALSITQSCNHLPSQTQFSVPNVPQNADTSSKTGVRCTHGASSIRGLTREGEGINVLFAGPIAGNSVPQTYISVVCDSLSFF
jgi:hypothetical protein